MRLYELIVEGYREAQAEFTVAAGNDTQDVKNLIQAYKDLVNKNQVTGQERKIDFWRKQGFGNFKDFVIGKQAVPTNTAVKRQKVPGKAINLVDNDNWLIVVPLDKDASCFHGKKSDWCTTKPFQEYFEDYFYDKEVTLIYCLNQRAGGMWAIAAHKKTDQIEMFDQKDRSLTIDAFRNETGLDPEALAKQAMGDIYQPQVASSRKEYGDAVEKLGTSWVGQDYSKPVPEIEKLLSYTKKPDLCAKYIAARGVSTKRATGDNNARVVVPKAILMSACINDAPAILYVDPSMLTDSTVLQLYKRNKGILDYIQKATGTTSMSPALLNEIFDIKTDAYHTLVGQGVHIPDDLLVKLISGGYYSAEQKAERKKAGMGEELATQIIGDLCRARAPISQEVANAGLKANGSVVGYLLDVGYKLSEQQLLTAIKSNGFAIEAIMDKELDTDRLRLEAINSSKGRMFYAICAYAKDRVTDREIDSAMEWQPMETFSLLVKNKLPIKPEFVEAALNIGTVGYQGREAEPLFDYLFAHPEYLTPHNISQMLKIDASEAGSRLLNASKLFGNPLKLSDSSLAKIAASDRYNARDILNSTDAADLTEDIQLGIASQKTLFKTLYKKVPNMSKRVLITAMHSGAGYDVLQTLINNDVKIDNDLMMGAAEDEKGAQNNLSLMLSNGVQVTEKVILEVMKHAYDPLDTLASILNAGYVPTDEMMFNCKRTSNYGLISAIELYINTTNYRKNIGIGKPLPPISEEVMIDAIKLYPSEMDYIISEASLDISEKESDILDHELAEFNKNETAREEEADRARQEWRDGHYGG